MTPTQQRCLEAIRTFWDKHGRSPSYGELMPLVGVKHRSGVHRIVAQLVSKGYIHPPRGEHYSLVLKSGCCPTCGKDLEDGGAPRNKYDDL